MYYYLLIQRADLLPVLSKKKKGHGICTCLLNLLPNLSRAYKIIFFIAREGYHIQYLINIVENDVLQFVVLGCGIVPHYGNKWKAQNWQDMRHTKGVNGKQKALSNDMEMIKTAYGSIIATSAHVMKGNLFLQSHSLIRNTLTQ